MCFTMAEIVEVEAEKFKINKSRASLEQLETRNSAKSRYKTPAPNMTKLEPLNQK